MSTEIITVSNNELAAAKTRAQSRGGTIVSEESLNGETRLTISYPAIDPSPAAAADDVVDDS